MHPKRTIFRDLRTDDRLKARFWVKVAIGGPDTCWPWLAYRGKSKRGLDYGKIGIDGRIHFAHRIAWELTNGPIPDGLRVLHRCDNPPCCNPAHLFLGTQGDNVQDMWDKQRHGARAKPPVGHRCRGEAHHSARLTATDVVEVRRLAADGMSIRAIAEQFGITPQSTRAIVQRKNWKHVA